MKIGYPRRLGYGVAIDNKGDRMTAKEITLAIAAVTAIALAMASPAESWQWWLGAGAATISSLWFGLIQIRALIKKGMGPLWSA